MCIRDRAYQLFDRLSESTGLSYTVSMAAMVLFAAGGACIMIFGIRQLILLAKNGASEFDKQPVSYTHLAGRLIGLGGCISGVLLQRMDYSGKF